MSKNFLKTINVLYVEDEEDVLELTSSFLSNFVNCIVTAKNGAEGLDLFKKYYDDDALEKIDLVITDINMPKMNGLEMLKAIGEIDHLIPSIVTTAHNDSSFLKEAINQRVRGYVTKPLNMHKLMDSILLVSEPHYLRGKLEKLNTELALKIEQKTFILKSILDAQDNLILVVSDDSLPEVNQTFLDFFGYKDLETFMDLHACICELFIENKNYFTSSNCDTWIEEILKLDDNKRIVVMKNAKNKNVIFRVNIRTFMFNTKHSVVSFTDITDLQHYTYELQYKASHDALTKLLNRQKFSEELEKEIIREKRYAHGLSIMMLDIDDFKRINDTYGHDIGDIVLKDIALIMQESIRMTDDACRWGGEEFTIILPETNIEEAFKIAQNIRIKIENYKNSTLDKNVTVSIGVAQFDLSKDNMDSFVKNSDLAMYEAKKTGKNKVVKYEK